MSADGSPRPSKARPQGADRHSRSPPSAGLAPAPPVPHALGKRAIGKSIENNKTIAMALDSDGCTPFLRTRPAAAWGGARHPDCALHRQLLGGGDRPGRGATEHSMGSLRLPPLREGAG